MAYKLCSDETRFSRFFIKKSIKECWEWTGSTRTNASGNKYGRFSIGSRIDGSKKSIGAHRFSYILYRGGIPDGLEVCYTCDNPICMNPHHLFLGTRRENALDALQKGRFNPRRGMDHHKAKLDKEGFTRVIELYSKGHTQYEVAEMMEISQPQVSRIIRRLRTR